LTKIAIVRGDLDAAEGYLETLSKDLVHGQAARKQLARLQSGETFRDDEEIRRIRSVKLGQDLLTDPLGREAMLKGLLKKKNAVNPMALEYLMAHYLLTCQVGRFAEAVGQVEQFEDAYMPPHYAEALVLHYSQTGQWQAAEDLPRDPGTVDRTQRFMVLSQKFASDPQGLARAVAMQMPRSYFGYYFAEKASTARP